MDVGCSHPVEDHEAEVDVDRAGAAAVVDDDVHGSGIVPAETVLLLVQSHQCAAAPRQLMRRRQPGNTAAYHRHPHRLSLSSSI